MADKTKILFAGDPHGNFAPLIQAVNTCHPDAVVLLGDYELKNPLEYYLHSILDKTEVWWIPGNHDYDSALHYENLFFSALSDFTLHLKVKEVAGVRIAGLGGIFLGRIWYPPQVPKWKSQQHFFSDENAPSKTSRLYLKYKSAIWHDEWESLKALKASV